MADDSGAACARRRQGPEGKVSRRIAAAIAVPGAGALAVFCLLQERASAPLQHAQPIVVTADPIAFDPREPGRVRFGRLRWIGGLVLRSPSPAFGGYSGLWLDNPGTRLLAVSDRGTWLSAVLVSEGGRPAGLAQARVGPLLNQDGEPLWRKTQRDAESLAALASPLSGDAFLISFERAHRILRFRFASDAFRAEKPVPLPEAARRLPANEGLESLTVLRAGAYAGALLAFAESASRGSDAIRGWLIKDGRADALSLRERDGFSVTALAALANGDVLALQRRYSNPAEGVRLRLLRLPRSSVAAGTLIEPETLLEADRRMTIDNMEGLAVVERPGAEPLVTMISDDNFNPLQRTLLLQFALDGGANDGGKD